MLKIRIGNDIRLAVELRLYIGGKKIAERIVYNPEDSNFENLDNNPFVNWNELYYDPNAGEQSSSISAGTNPVCIRSVKAILINDTLKQKRIKDLKNKSRFISRFPMEPHMMQYVSSPYNIHNSGYPTWRAYPKNHMFASYHGFGVNPDWNDIYREIPVKNDIEYLADTAATNKQGVVEVIFPAEHQLHTGVYSLVIVAKVYAPGFNSSNVKTYTIDVPNVFELVSTSADGIDSDMFINVSTLMDKLPEGDDVNPEDLDIYVRGGEFENNTLTLDRTNGTSLDINLNEAAGWYEGE